MKVLVLGYSVTAEGPGFVEIAAQKLGKNSNVTLVKAGLGGVQPYHARHLFPSILRHHKPDAVILDQSTPGYRNFLRDRNVYFQSLHALLRDIQAQNLLFGFLELPRVDVDFSNDWVVDYHTQLAEEFKVPQVFVPFQKDLLRDEVHPTEVGRKIFADALLSMLDLLAPFSGPSDLFATAPRYDALLATNLVGEHMPRYLLSRGGYEENMVLVGSELTLTLPFENKHLVHGFSGLMWPRCGAFDIRIGDRTIHHQMYNEFCYYPRMGAVLFAPPHQPEQLRASWASFHQRPELPDIPLRKGRVNTMPRLGAVGSIFIENPRDTSNE